VANWISRKTGLGNENRVTYFGEKAGFRAVERGAP
jgi:hypothetical protein